jgi:hypothetical protein
VGHHEKIIKRSGFCGALFWIIGLERKTYRRKVDATIKAAATISVSDSYYAHGFRSHSMRGGEWM